MLSLEAITGSRKGLGRAARTPPDRANCQRTSESSLPQHPTAMTPQTVSPVLGSAQQEFTESIWETVYLLSQTRAGEPLVAGDVAVAIVKHETKT